MLVKLDKTYIEINPNSISYLQYPDYSGQPYKLSLTNGEILLIDEESANRIKQFIYTVGSQLKEA